MVGWLVGWSGADRCASLVGRRLAGGGNRSLNTSEMRVGTRIHQNPPEVRVAKIGPRNSDRSTDRRAHRLVDRPANCPTGRPTDRPMAP